MTTIPERTKAQLKNPGVKFNRAPLSETQINGGLIELAVRAVGNAINDDKQYTVRINFRNGRIVGSGTPSRLSVELLEGRAATTRIGVLETSKVVYVEFSYLQIDGFPLISNDNSWVARAKIDGAAVLSAYVNNDFSEEDRELIKKVLTRGFAEQIRM